MAKSVNRQRVAGSIHCHVGGPAVVLRIGNGIYRSRQRCRVLSAHVDAGHLPHVRCRGKSVAIGTYDIELVAGRTFVVGCGICHVAFGAEMRETVGLCTRRSKIAVEAAKYGAGSKAVLGRIGTAAVDNHTVGIESKRLRRHPEIFGCGRYETGDFARLESRGLAVFHCPANDCVR